MVEKDVVSKEEVEHEGIFSFKGFYSYAYEWLKNEEYGVDEEKYTEKISGNKRDIFIQWKVTKRLSDYFKIEHRVRIIVSGLTDVEVEIDGVKKQMNKGKVKVELKSNLVSDPESKWDKSPTHRFFRDIYNKYIIPSRVDYLKGQVIEDIQTFKDDLKSFLELSARR